MKIKSFLLLIIAKELFRLKPFNTQTIALFVVEKTFALEF